MLLGFALGPWEIMIAMVLGVLLFGRRLPEVGRSLGKGIVEFKKGLKGVEDDIDASMNQNYGNGQQQANPEPPRPPQRLGTTAPKFEDQPAPQPAAQPTDSEGKPRV
jgi:sec-independent protein translocase protein TatA